MDDRPRHTPDGEVCGQLGLYRTPAARPLHRASLSSARTPTPAHDRSSPDYPVRSSSPDGVASTVFLVLPQVGVLFAALSSSARQVGDASEETRTPDQSPGRATRDYPVRSG